MKTTHYLALLLVLFCTLPVWAAKQEVCKKKEITKSFNVGKDDRLQVDNRHGNITIAHWDKNEISIRVEIEMKANNEKKAQYLMDRVKIDLGKSGNTVSAVTSFSIEKQNNFSGSFTINYYIDMPDGLFCRLEQLYGNIYLPENNKGEHQINVRYGNLKAGNFTAPLLVEVKYGVLEIGNAEQARLNLAYCNNSSVGNCPNLTAKCGYSNLVLGDIQQLILDSRYSNFRIERIGKGDMKLSYGKCELDALEQSLSIAQLSYSKFAINDLAAHFSTLNVNAQYSDFNVHIDKKASFGLTANQMRYGSCRVEGGFKVTQRSKEEQSADFDSRNAQKSKDDYLLDINGGKNGKILFFGNNYSNIKVIAK